MTKGAILRFSPCIAALVFLLAATEDLHAQAHCSRPIRPVCAITMPGADIVSSRMKCRGDADRYLASLQEYRACLEGGLADATARMEAAERFRSCLQEERSDCSLK